MYCKDELCTSYDLMTCKCNAQAFSEHQLVARWGRRTLYWSFSRWWNLEPNFWNWL